MATVQPSTLPLELSHVEQHLRLQNRQVAKAWNGLRELVDGYRPAVLVVNAGMLKAGKSTLFNAIAGRDIFATGDVRVTVVNQPFEAGTYTLLDTPGLDACEEDTAEAWKAYHQADLIVFVHNLLEGDLHRLEVDFLAQVREALPVGGFAHRLLVVGTNRHQLANEAVPAVRERLLEQLRTLGDVSEQQLFLTDAATYQSGQADGKDELVERSGLRQLLLRLTTLAGECGSGKGALFADRFAARKAGVIDALNQVRQRRAGEGAEVFAEEARLQGALNALTSAGKLVQGVENRLSLQTPEVPRPYFHVDFGSASTSDYSTRHKSEYAATSAATSAFERNFYSRCLRAMGRVKQQLEEHYRPYLRHEASQENPFHHMKLEAAGALGAVHDSVARQLKEYGLRTPPATVDLPVGPEQVAYERNEVGRYLESMNDMEPANWYLKANIDITERTTTERGWFGDRTVEYYHWDIRAAVRDLEEDVREKGREAESSVRNALSKALADFARQMGKAVRTEAVKMAAELQDQVRAQEAALAKVGQDASVLKQELAALDEQMAAVTALRGALPA